MPHTENGKAFALTKLAERRKDVPVKVDNSSLIAGSPMFFYCVSCRHISDVKPEDYVSEPKKLCEECEALKVCGWLE